MTILDLISENIPAIGPADNVSTVLGMMDATALKHLPLVENDKLKGVLSEMQLRNIPDKALAAADAPLCDDVRPMEASQPPLRLLAEVEQHGADIVPIVDKQNRYLGCVTGERLNHELTAMLGAYAEGAEISVSMRTIDYSLTRIVNIIEECDVHILSITTREIPSHGTVEVHIKTNTTNVQPVADALERFGYDVTTLEYEHNNDSTLRRNYENLMQYLNY